MSKKYFIDIHCHLFNIEHIPLRQSIRRISHSFNKGLVKRGIIATGAFVVAPLMVLGSNALAKKFYKVYEAFIRFFDQPAEDNIRYIVQSLDRLDDNAGMGERQRIFTPLVMDFEICESYKSLSQQVGDLSKAIEAKTRFLVNHKTIILPFLGMDLRRFHADQGITSAKAVKDFFEQAGVSFKPADIRHNPDKLVNGDFIGIKLYPSLGFDIYPHDANLLNRNVAVLKQLKDLDLPVTTHCQIASYECDPGEISNGTLVNFANPQKWWELLNKYPSLQDMRINFAHFGGEEGVGYMASMFHLFTHAMFKSLLFLGAGERWGSRVCGPPGWDR